MVEKKEKVKVKEKVKEEEERDLRILSWSLWMVTRMASSG